MTLPIWEQNVRQTPPMNKEIAFKNLLDVKKVFDKHNIRYVLTFGTLLGAIREKSFLDWDDDVDILCFREDYLKVEPAFKELDSVGFFIPRVGIPLLDHYLIRDTEKVDINWLVDNGHGELMYADWIKWSKEYFKFPLPSIELFGEKFTVPHNPEKWLAFTYGPTWRIPDKNKRGFKWK